MQIQIKSPSTVPAGRYQATFEGIEEKTSKRDGAPYYRWTFTARTSDGVKDVSGVSSTNTGPKSKAFGWLAGLLDRKPQPNEMLDASALVGRPCVVTLEENEDGFANVTDVQPGQLTEATDKQLDELPF